MSGSLDTSDILVVVDKGDQLKVSLQPPDQYGVSIKSGDTYVVNIDLPTTIVAQETDTYYRVADFAYAVTSASYAVTASYVVGDAGVTDWTEITNKPSGLVSSSVQINTGSFNGTFTGQLIGTSSQASSASFALTASYAQNSISDWTQINNKPVGLVSSSVQINTGSFTGSFTGDITAPQINLKTDSKVVKILPTTLINIFDETALIDPLISTTEFSGVAIEYNAQRINAARFGVVMASWSGSEIVYTDNSTNDIGDTADLSFNLVKAGNDIRVRAYSAGLGSGTWNIGLTFTLFPKLL